MAIDLEAIKRAAETQRAAGVSEADLITYGRNVGLTEEEIAYALGKTKTPPTKGSDLNKVLENAEYISKLAGDLGDTDVTAGEALALSDPTVRRLAEAAWQAQNVNKISDAELAKYGTALGLNQDLIDYLLGTDKTMELGTGNYDIAGNIAKAVNQELKIQDAIRNAKLDPAQLTPSQLASVADAFTNSPESLEGLFNFIKTGVRPPVAGGATSTVTGGKGNDTITGGKGSDTISGAGGGAGAAGNFSTALRYGAGMGGDRVGTGVALGEESGLRSGYAPYVQRMLERASAEADVPFQKYMGESPLLESARAGIANLTTPAQFQQGSNLATAAGIGALGYGQYKPTSFITGTFANPAFTRDASPDTRSLAKDFFTNYTGSAPTSEQLATYDTWAKGNPNASFKNAVDTLYPLVNPPTKAAEGGLMSLKRFQTGDLVVGGSPTTTNLSGQDVASGQPVASLAPVNYGGQNVTNVQASYMSPYMQGVVDPALREAKRQSEIQGMTNAAKFTQAGAFGGTRNVLADAERQRNLMTQLGDIQGMGLQKAYESGLGQFNVEQNRGLEAQKMAEQSRQFGSELGLKGLQTGIQAGQVLGGLGAQQGQLDLAALKLMGDLGKEQRDFDYQEFLRGEKYPYENLRFMQSMLSGLPISAAPTGIDPMSQALSGGISSAYLANLLGALGGKGG